jgi:hypothetical protein
LKEYVVRCALVVGSTIASLLLLELGYRVIRDPSVLSRLPEMIEARLDGSAATTCAVIHDPLLGWRHNALHSRPGFHLTPDGFRITPPLEPAAHPLLATGSSFTEGAEVDDDETWPAYLQEMVGRKVVNAGVSAYALDQTVLATERLAAKLRPSMIVASFTPPDIENLELSKSWWLQKPYFVLGDRAGLEIRNVPVPNDVDLCKTGFWRTALGWSSLARLAIDSLGFWDDLPYVEQRAMPEGSGERLVCPLMARLSRLAMPVLVVGEVNRDTWENRAALPDNRRRLAHVLQCARDVGLATLDMFPVLESVASERGLDFLYREEHLSPEGNLLVARTIADALTQTRITGPR